MIIWTSSNPDERYCVHLTDENVECVYLDSSDPNEKIKLKVEVKIQDVDYCDTLILSISSPYSHDEQDMIRLRDEVKRYISSPEETTLRELVERVAETRQIALSQIGQNPAQIAAQQSQTFFKK